MDILFYFTLINKHQLCNTDLCLWNSNRELFSLFFVQVFIKILMAQTILGHKSNGVIDHPYSSGSSKSQHSNSDSIKKFKHFDIFQLETSSRVGNKKKAF